VHGGMQGSEGLFKKNNPPKPLWHASGLRCVYLDLGGKRSTLLRFHSKSSILRMETCPTSISLISGSLRHIIPSLKGLRHKKKKNRESSLRGEALFVCFGFFILLKGYTLINLQPPKNFPGKYRIII